MSRIVSKERLDDGTVVVIYDDGSTVHRYPEGGRLVTLAEIPIVGNVPHEHRATEDRAIDGGQRGTEVPPSSAPAPEIDRFLHRDRRPPVVWLPTPPTSAEDEVPSAPRARRRRTRPGLSQEDALAVPDTMRSGTSRFRSDMRLRNPATREAEARRRELGARARELGTGLGRLHAYLRDLINRQADEPRWREFETGGGNYSERRVWRVRSELQEAIDAGLVRDGRPPAIVGLSRGLEANELNELARELPGFAIAYENAYEIASQGITQGYLIEAVLAVVEVATTIVSLRGGALIRRGLLRSMRQAARRLAQRAGGRGYGEIAEGAVDDAFRDVYRVTRPPRARASTSHPEPQVETTSRQTVPSVGDEARAVGQHERGLPSAGPHNRTPKTYSQTEAERATAEAFQTVGRPATKLPETPQEWADYAIRHGDEASAILRRRRDEAMARDGLRASTNPDLLVANSQGGEDIFDALVLRGDTINPENVANGVAKKAGRQSNRIAVFLDGSRTPPARLIESYETYMRQFPGQSWFDPPAEEVVLVWEGRIWPFWRR